MKQKEILQTSSRITRNKSKVIPRIPMNGGMHATL